MQVSVVIPLYDAERFIGRALASVLRQTVQEFELVVVDDGSRDAGAEIVRRMGDPRVRLLQQPNGGDAAARNAGIRAARSSLVALLDADDEWAPGFLAAVLELAERFPEAGLYATGYRRALRGGFAIDVSVAPETAGQDQLLVRDYFRRAREYPFVTASSVAIPRRVFDELGGFVGEVGAGSDRDLWARVALDYPIACDTRILAVYHGEHADGRVSRRRRLRPRFAETARAVLERGAAAPELRDELLEYLHSLWVSQARRAVVQGDRREARRILREELGRTRAYRGFVWRTRLLLLLPGRLAARITRFALSRWWFRMAHPFRCGCGILRFPHQERG